MIFVLFFLISLNIVYSQFQPDRIYHKWEPRNRESINYVPRHIFDPLIHHVRTKRSALSKIKDYSNSGIDTYWNYIQDSSEKGSNKYTSLLATKKHSNFHCYSVYRTATDDWCQDNCQLGYCPTSHCICTTSQPKFVTSNKAVNSKYVYEYDDNDDNDEQQKQTDFESYQWDSSKNQLRYQ